MSQSLVSNFAYKRATIASGDNLSSEIPCLGHILMGVEIPSSWTTTDLTLEGSFDGVTYRDVTDEDDNLVTFSSIAGNQILLISATSPMIAGFVGLKLYSVTPQGGDRTVNVLFGVPSP